MPRRFRSYATMGLTGQILVFMQLISATVEVYRSNGVLTLIKALPDRDVVATQRLSGLALPFADLIEDHPGMKKDLPMFVETFADPAFLETFFILSSQSDLDRGFGVLDIFLVFSKVSFTARRRDEYILRLLSLRKLPQNKPSWSDGAKLLFEELLGKLFVEVRTLEAFDSMLTCSVSRRRNGRQRPTPVQNSKPQRRRSWSVLLHWSAVVEYNLIYLPEYVCSERSSAF